MQANLQNYIREKETLAFPFLIIFSRFSLTVLDDFTDQDMKNIERIYKNVLMTTKSREQRKARVKKYLGWVSQQPKRKTSCCCCSLLFFNVVSGNSKKSERLEHGVKIWKKSHLSSHQRFLLSMIYIYTYISRLES